MTLADSVSLWEIANPNKEWFDFVVDTNQHINKQALWGYLYMEYCDMTVVDSNSQAFHMRVENFFDIHRWNIDKMSATMEFEYEPLNDFGWTQSRKMDREQEVETVTDRDKVEELEQNAVNVWEEQGTSNGTDVHFISAFNDVPSPTSDNPPRYEDTEQYRDTHSNSHHNDGTSEDELNSTKGTQEDINKNEDLVEGVKEDIAKSGLSDRGNHTYQSLIEEERKQAEFNIYKWIGRHFAHELLIAVW